MTRLSEVPSGHVVLVDPLVGLVGPLLVVPAANDVATELKKTIICWPTFASPDARLPVVPAACVGFEMIAYTTSTTTIPPTAPPIETRMTRRVALRIPRTATTRARLPALRETALLRAQGDAPPRRPG